MGQCYLGHIGNSMIIQVHPHQCEHIGHPHQCEYLEPQQCEHVEPHQCEHVEPHQYERVENTSVNT